MVKEFTQIIQDLESDKFNLIAIGLEFGFISELAFINRFKRHDRLTPSDFKKTLNDLIKNSDLMQSEFSLSKPRNGHFE